MNLFAQSHILTGLLAAVFWGGGDFSGGMGAKHAGGTITAALRIILVSHAASFCILLTLASLRGDTFPHGAPLIWAVAAGVTGGLSLMCFYIALARGEMGTSAAISGLLAAAIPALLTLFTDGSPGTPKLIGFTIAGIAIWMIAAPAGGASISAPAAASTMGLAIVAGTGFGLYFIALKMAGTGGILWPMAAARVGSLTVCIIMLLFLSLKTGGASFRIKLPNSAILWALSTALLDTCGNLLFLAATRAGRLDVAAVLASLYPATTIILAVFMLKEHFNRRQAFGMAAAAAAVVLIAL